MERVGVRKVKSKLSSYLRRGKRGETILVTERGKTIAELRPHTERDQEEASRLENALERLAREGKLKRPGSRRGHAMDAWAGWKGLGTSFDSMELLDATRGEVPQWPALR